MVDWDRGRLRSVGGALAGWVTLLRDTERDDFPRGTDPSMES